MDETKDCNDNQGTSELVRESEETMFNLVEWESCRS